MKKGLVLLGFILICGCKQRAEYLAITSTESKRIIENAPQQQEDIPEFYITELKLIHEFGTGCIK